jgi:Plasmid pRiA4b ORF-3-like protein
VRCPQPIDAVGRFPPEDSGGPSGDMDLLAALRDPALSRHAEVIEWPDPDFDPNDGHRAKLKQDLAAGSRLSLVIGHGWNRLVRITCSAGTIVGYEHDDPTKRRDRRQGG